jgi:hypothetical protein
MWSQEAGDELCERWADSIFVNQVEKPHQTLFHCHLVEKTWMLHMVDWVYNGARFLDEAIHSIRDQT